jgi:hypothetical protein
MTEIAFHAAPPSASGPRVLCVMLPGLMMTPADFLAAGFIDDAQQGPGHVDVVIPAFRSDDYLQGTFSRLLDAEILGPARAKGYRRIVCLGISLGGFGAVLHGAQGGCADLDRLILLAPFLSNPGTLVEVQQAGGLRAWAPMPRAPGDIERPALLWLKSHIASGRTPSVQLGYGSADRFVQASALLAELLPGEAVAINDGGHDWPTWRALWRVILERTPLAGQG